VTLTSDGAQTAAPPHVGTPAAPGGSAVSRAATRSIGALLSELAVTAERGLSAQEAIRRRAEFGLNAVSSHRARLLPVLWHQLRSPLLGLLLTAALASNFVGERNDALIIGLIVGLSVGLGFLNEYRAEKAAEALHDQVHHETVVLRDGRSTAVDVTALVPGDVIELRLGVVVPADVRLLDVVGLECDESVLTGESMPADKSTAAVPPGTPLAELSGCSPSSPRPAQRPSTSVASSLPRASSWVGPPATAAPSWGSVAASCWGSVAASCWGSVAASCCSPCSRTREGSRGRWRSPGATSSSREASAPPAPCSPLSFRPSSLDGRTCWPGSPDDAAPPAGRCGPSSQGSSWSGSGSSAA
jgi:hypothetical protein